jgi:hypothetical protein
VAGLRRSAGAAYGINTETLLQEGGHMSSSKWGVWGWQTLGAVCHA